MKFLLDFGHCLSGADTGARDVMVEEIETRNLGKVVKTKLEALGHTAVVVSVDYARTLDEALSARVNNANREGGDLFVSFHFNSFTNAKGHEVYCYQFGSTGEKYARAVNAELAKLNFTVNRGVKTANFYVLRNTKMSAILIETCFVQNPDATNYNRENCANAIVRGLTGQEPVSTPTITEIYRVRTAYDNASSQIGAFSNLDSAKACADAHPGYVVYDSKFNRVYPSESSSQPTEQKKGIAIVYGNEVDQMACKYVHWVLGGNEKGVELIDGNIPTDYSKYERVICIGGLPSAYGKWTCYATDVVSAGDRVDTLYAALKLVGR